MSRTTDGGETVRTGPRPFWSRVGGGGLILGSVLELVETVFWSWAQGAGATERLFGVNAALLVLAGAVIAVAAFALAFGRSGSDIVGGSGLGRAALVAFAVAQLVAKVVTSLYFAIPPDRSGAALVVSAAATGLAIVALLVAAIVIARAHIAQGVARWSLFLVIVGGPGIALVTTFAPSLAQPANIAATVLQGLVGASYLRRRASLQRSSSWTRSPDPRHAE